MGNLNLNLYRVLCVIPNCKSYSEVGEKLNISKSAVSKDITTLEKHLNKKLVYRDSNGIRLTEEGMGVYERIFMKLVSMENEEYIGEEIKIGSYSHINSFYLMEKIANAKNDNPNLKFTFVNNMRRNELFNALIENRVNFAIDNNETEIIDDRIRKQKLKDVDNIFIFNKPLKIDNIKDLQNFNYILDTKSSTDKRLMKLLKENGVSIHADIDMDVTELKIDAVKKGLGITHIIKDAAREAIKNKEVYEVDIPIELPKSPIVLLYLNENLRKIDKDFIKKYLV